MKILFSSGAWQTKRVLYQNAHLSFRKVEFQMQDMMITSEVSNDIDKQVGWKKVEKDMNGIELKTP